MNICPSPVSADTPRTRTLLLVDDEENILSALKRVLRREGYTVLSAGGGAEGLQLLAAHPVDVIVSDQRMPGMTGVEFLRQARQLYPDTVRIVLSGYTELQSITDAINEGAIYKFLTKPWDDELIRANIAEAFRQKELASDNAALAVRLAEANAELQALLKEKQHRLQLDEASLDIAREALDCLPFPLLGIDEQGQIVLANASACSTLGSAGMLLGEPALEVLPAALQEFVHAGEVCARLELDGQKMQLLTRRMGSHSRSRGSLWALLPYTVLEGA